MGFNKSNRVSFFNQVQILIWIYCKIVLWFKTHHWCDVTPLAPTLHQLLRTISLNGRWSTSGSDRGITHFFTATRNTIEGVEEKKEQTNNMLGLTRVQKESYVTLCMCRLMLAWILAKLLQSYWNADSSWPVFLTVAGPYLMPTGLSAVPCWLVSCVTLRQLFLELLLSYSLTGFPFLLPVTRDLESRTLCLVSHQNRQRDYLLGGPPT